MLLAEDDTITLIWFSGAGAAVAGPTPKLSKITNTGRPMTSFRRPGIGELRLLNKRCIEAACWAPGNMRPRGNASGSRSTGETRSAASGAYHGCPNESDRLYSIDVARSRRPKGGNLLTARLYSVESRVYPSVMDTKPNPIHLSRPTSLRISLSPNPRLCRAQARLARSRSCASCDSFDHRGRQAGELWGAGRSPGATPLRSSCARRRIRDPG